MNYCSKLRVETKLSTIFPNLQNLQLKTVSALIAQEDVLLDFFQIHSLKTLNLGIEHRYVIVGQDQKSSTIPKTIKCTQLQDLELDTRYLSVDLCVHIVKQLKKLKYIKFTPQILGSSYLFAKMILQNCRQFRFDPYYCIITRTDV